MTRPKYAISRTEACWRTFDRVMDSRAWAWCVFQWHAWITSLLVVTGVLFFVALVLGHIKGLW